MKRLRKSSLRPSSIPTMDRPEVFEAMTASLCACCSILSKVSYHIPYRSPLTSATYLPSMIIVQTSCSVALKALALTSP